MCSMLELYQSGTVQYIVLYYIVSYHMSQFKQIHSEKLQTLPAEPMARVYNPDKKIKLPLVFKFCCVSQVLSESEKVSWCCD